MLPEWLELPLLVVGLLLALVVASRPLLAVRSSQRARITPDGEQEARVTVRGRYTPSTVVAKRGVPIRLLFDRQEDSICSERVIFAGINQERWLAPFATTTVRLVPKETGEFLFTCSMGMYQGKLVVTE